MTFKIKRCDLWCTLANIAQLISQKLKAVGLSFTGNAPARPKEHLSLHLSLCTLVLLFPMNGSSAMHFLHTELCLSCMFCWLHQHVQKHCMCTACGHNSMKRMQLFSGSPKGASKAGAVPRQMQAFISHKFGCIVVQRKKCCSTLNSALKEMISIPLCKITNLVCTLLKS